MPAEPKAIQVWQDSRGNNHIHKASATMANATIQAEDDLNDWMDRQDFPMDLHNAIFGIPPGHDGGLNDHIEVLAAILNDYIAASKRFNSP